MRSYSKINWIILVAVIFYFGIVGIDRETFSLTQSGKEISKDDAFGSIEGSVKNIGDKNLAKFIVLASNHGMGSTATIDAIHKMHPCIIRLAEPFDTNHILSSPNGERNAILFSNGTFIGVDMDVHTKLKLKLSKNFDPIPFGGDVYPKHAAGILDWFTQLHAKLSVGGNLIGCNMAYPTILLKMFPVYVSFEYKKSLREFLSSEDSVVVHQTRNYKDTRSSNIRRFGGDGGGKDNRDKKWDAWLDRIGVDMIDVKAEDIWAQPNFEGYRSLVTEVYNAAGIPQDGMKDFELVRKILKKQHENQHSMIFSPIPKETEKKTGNDSSQGKG